MQTNESTALAYLVLVDENNYNHARNLQSDAFSPGGRPGNANEAEDIEENEDDDNEDYGDEDYEVLDDPEDSDAVGEDDTPVLDEEDLEDNNLTSEEAEDIEWEDEDEENDEA